MAKETELRIGPGLRLVEIEYYTGSADVFFKYIEYSPDPYYSDAETDVDLTKEDAEKIIAFLKSAFQID